jgi:hypothetical protein
MSSTKQATTAAPKTYSPKRKYTKPDSSDLPLPLRGSPHKPPNFPIHPLINPRIQKNPHDATFFTNRAITRIKLAKWADVEHDARAAIEIYGLKNPTALKSHYYLAQALLGLQRPQEAYDIASDAYQQSLAAKSPQTENLSRIVLRAKQQIWAARETSRIRELDETLGAVEVLIQADVERALGELRGRLGRGEIGEVGFGEDERGIREDAEVKVRNLREAFRIASKGDISERVCCFGFGDWWSAPRTDFAFSRLFLIISLMASLLRLCMILLLRLLARVSIASALRSMLRRRVLIL